MAWRKVVHIRVVQIGVDLGRKIDGRNMDRAARVDGPQQTVKVHVGDAVARAETFDCIEAKMDAEEDAAGCILGSRLAEAREMPGFNLANVVQDDGRNRLMDVLGNAVKLIGDERKRNTEVNI